MRVIQIIDSLEMGGAERMAVNYANALVGKIDFSGIVVTRKEGVLKDQVDFKVPYFFLKKNKTLDLNAVFRLKKYLIEKKIDIIHAHGSSFFIAVLVKLAYFKIKIVWHDHYGKRARESRRENRVLIFLSSFFSSVFVVNDQLEEWSRNNLHCSKIVFVPNFTISQNIDAEITHLKGIENKRIVFLANLKKPKNHIFFLESFYKLKLNDEGWTLHLIGKDYFDLYSNELKIFIKSNSLENNVYLYGMRSDTKHILSQASIGVLASTEEGFPVTLLEYGLEGLAVVSTNAGFCAKIIKDNYSGLLFDPSSYSDIQEQLYKLVNDNDLRIRLGKNLQKSIVENYSEEMIIKKIMLEYKNIVE